MYGFDAPQALIERTWRELYDAEEIERFETEIFPKVEASGRWRGKARGRRASGEAFPQELRLQRLSDGQLVCIVRDRSEAENVQSDRREAMLRLEAVVRDAPLVVFELDQDGVFTLSRGRALDRVGLEPDEVVGESVFDVYADHPGILDDARRALADEEVEGTNEVAGRIFETRWRPTSSSRPSATEATSSTRNPRAKSWAEACSIWT